MMIELTITERTVLYLIVCADCGIAPDTERPQEADTSIALRTLIARGLVCGHDWYPYGYQATQAGRDALDAPKDRLSGAA